MLTLRPFTGSDEDYEVMATIRQDAYKDNRMRAKDFKRIDDYTPPEEYDWARTMAEWNGRTVGYGLYTRALWLKAPNYYLVGWLTHPDFRRRGIASAYWDYLQTEIFPQRHIEALVADVRGDVPDGPRFMEKRGFQQVLTTTESVLDLTTFDPAPHMAKTAVVAKYGLAFTPLSELMQNDPDYLAKLVELEWVMRQDEPTADEPAPITPDMFRNYYMSSGTFYPEGWFIAVQNGRYVGWCAVLPNPERPDQVSNGITVIARDFRRRGLATAMKLHVIEHAGHMGATTIRTSNVSTNPMLSINQQLGYKPQFDMFEYKKMM